MTQPLGHSTSGSHERYKTEERLKWEFDNDCNKKFEEWIINNKLSSKKKLDNIKKEISNYVKEEKRLAWDLYLRPIKEAKSDLIETINSLSIKISKDKLNEMFNNVDDDNFSEIIKICRGITYQLETW